MTKKFFGRENLQTAIWALVIAFVCFLAGYIWKSFTGPDQVYVVNDENRSRTDTTVTIFRIDGDSLAINAIRGLETQINIQSTKGSPDYTASVLRPRLSLPGIVEGYTQKSINSYASIDIPRLTYSRNETVELQLSLFDESVMQNISPIFIDLHQEIGKNRIRLIWSEQFQITHTNNKIRFGADFPRGEYTLSLGFYFMDELHQKYPPKYLKKMNLTII